jgi:hypothetical protein
MTQQVVYGPIGAKISLMTTELTSLGVSTLSILGPEINNTGGPLQGQITGNFGSAVFSPGNTLSIYFLPSTDLAGAAYPTLRNAVQEALGNYKRADLIIPGTTAAQIAMVSDVTIPGGKFKTFAMTSSGCPVLVQSTYLDFYPTPININSI